MQPATGGSLSEDQRKYRDQLAVAIENINEADETLKNTNDVASNRATALALAAIARILVLENAEKWGMSTRLPALKRAPK